MNVMKEEKFQPDEWGYYGDFEVRISRNAASQCRRT
jgi:hypothetical protein